MIKQKVYLLPENQDQLSNLNIRFVSVLLFFIDKYAFNCYFKKCFNCCDSFALSLVDKVTTEHKRFVSVIANVGT